jgi:hypothetical protein
MTPGWQPGRFKVAKEVSHVRISSTATAPNSIRWFALKTFSSLVALVAPEPLPEPIRRSTVGPSLLVSVGRPSQEPTMPSGRTHR